MISLIALTCHCPKVVSSEGGSGEGLSYGYLAVLWQSVPSGLPQPRKQLTLPVPIVDAVEHPSQSPLTLATQDNRCRLHWRLQPRASDCSGTGVCGFFFSAMSRFRTSRQHFVSECPLFCDILNIVLPQCFPPLPGCCISRNRYFSFPHWEENETNNVGGLGLGGNHAG